ncbi:hypothetical protein [uncultured Brevibacillus sp.]|uniref:hypothetical protein n=1 Tax=uncultured Brevibacillus sp. TaxID=169970 RepID=UPI002594CEBD|nr:hypothetical protein [uncultured Brevibacillus sp.]
MKKAVLCLSSLVLILTLAVTPSSAEKRLPQRTLLESTKEFKSLMDGNGEIAFINQNDVDLAELRKEVPFGGLVVEEAENPKFSKTSKAEKFKYFGSFKDSDDEVVPVYLTSDSELSEEQFREIGKEILDEYKDKDKGEENIQMNDSNNSMKAPALQYYPTSRALKINVSDGGKVFWNTEYRVYIGGTTTKINYFYLRADHQSKTSKDITGFKSQWWPKWSAYTDLLDPMPVSKSRTNQVSISIPAAITWITDINSDVRIESTFDQVDDHAVWYVTNPMLVGPYKQTMPNFSFSQGTHIEADRSKDGFRMNVNYDIWKSDSHNINSSPWLWWEDTIYFVLSDDDLDFND